MKQVELVRVEFDGISWYPLDTHLTTWVNRDDLKAGDHLTLKRDLSEWWAVLTVYDQRIESVADLNRGWNNNI